MIRDIRRTKPFISYQDALEWTVKKLTHPSRMNLTLPPDEDWAAIISTTAPIWRIQLMNGAAVLRLAQKGLSESSFPIIRTMMELDADIAFILEHAPDPSRARDADIWMTMLFTTTDKVDRSRVAASLAAYKQLDAEKVAVLEERFKKGKYGHFSGHRWQRLVSVYGGEGATTEYADLSWLTHAIMQKIGPTIPQGARIVSYTGIATKRELAESNCRRATNVLLRTWTRVRSSWGSVIGPMTADERQRVKASRA